MPIAGRYGPRRRRRTAHPAHDGDQLLEPGRQADLGKSVEKLFGELPRFFKDEDELRRLWSKPDTRKALLQGLAEKGFGREQLFEISRIIERKSAML